MNDDITPKIESETPSYARDYSDSRLLEKMETDSIGNKTGSLEANKASEFQIETQTDTKLLLTNMLAAISASMQAFYHSLFKIGMFTEYDKSKHSRTITL